MNKWSTIFWSICIVSIASCEAIETKARQEHDAIVTKAYVEQGYTQNCGWVGCTWVKK